MILTADEINQHVESGNITISPFSPSQLGTISYKFRLGDEISAVKTPLDSKKPISLVFEKMPDSGYVLEPGVLYLAQTHEVMGSPYFAQQIFATRDVGSSGIFIHVSADLGHSGAITQWTLEIATDHRITLYPHQFIGQIIFWHQEGDRSTYNGKYQSMQQSLPSQYWKEFQD